MKNIYAYDKFLNELRISGLPGYETPRTYIPDDGYIRETQFLLMLCPVFSTDGDNREFKRHILFEDTLDGYNKEKLLDYMVIDEISDVFTDFNDRELIDVKWHIPYEKMMEYKN